MQTYLHQGWGCAGSLLTDEEAERYFGNPDVPSPEEGIGIQFQSCTEDFTGRDYGALVVRDLGPAGHLGHYLDEAAAMAFLQTRLSNKNRAAMEALLHAEGLARLIPHIGPIFFHVCY